MADPDALDNDSEQIDNVPTDPRDIAAIRGALEDYWWEVKDNEPENFPSWESVKA